MARRENYYYPPRPVKQPHPILGGMLGCFVTLAICYILISVCGPFVDYIALYVASQPDGAAGYANAVLPLYSWVYAFIVIIGVIAVAGVWIAVVRSLTYTQYGG